ncbi:MAG: GNAT family N-acetyltransferase [Rhodospirillales bacterium]|nr:GNAT family N-acetyltransferase [Rhodospirillales bacterium]
MTNENTTNIRAAKKEDLGAICEIYAHYVDTTTATYEEVAPDSAEMTKRWQNTIKGNHPYLVAELEGNIIGYGYAGTYRSRSGYRHTVEDSVYLSPEATGKGIGKLLLNALIDECTERGFRQMIAVIGEPNNHASIKLHVKAGFEQVGLLPAVGFKFGRWVDTVLLMRPLGDANKSLPKE